MWKKTHLQIHNVYQNQGEYFPVEQYKGRPQKYLTDISQQVTPAVIIQSGKWRRKWDASIGYH